MVSTSPAISSPQLKVSSDYLIAAIDEFRETILPAYEEGLLPLRTADEYRFRVTYPPTRLIPTFRNGEISDWTQLIPQNCKVALYLHVPFCHRICTFCHFAVQRLAGESTLSEFVDLILRELDMWLKILPSNTKFDSIYIGGGTPTALSVELLGRLLGSVRSRIGDQDLEFTVESSPGTFTDAKASILGEHGVTRISLKIQDLTQPLPKLLGRDHDAECGVRAIQRAVKHWSRTTNVDLIFGLPGQSFETWFAMLRTVQDLCVPSVTVYQIHVAANTPLRTMWERQRESFPEERTNLLLRWLAHHFFLTCGRIQDPLDWYVADPEAFCMHQRHKWSGSVGIIGIGPGAYWGSPEITGRNMPMPIWRNLVRKNCLPVARCGLLSPETAAARYAVFALKTAKGVSRRRLLDYLSNSSGVIKTCQVESNPRLLESDIDGWRIVPPLGLLRIEELAEGFFDRCTVREIKKAGMSSYAE